MVLAQLLNHTLSQEQLIYPLILLGLVGTYILAEKKGTLKIELGHQRGSFPALVATFVILIAAIFIKVGLLLQGLLLYIAFGLLLYSLFNYLFARHTSRAANSLVAGFMVFILLALSLESLDWAMRGISGSWSAWFLEVFGNTTNLFLLQRESNQLILMVNDIPFHVAQECNGFGLLGASLLLTTLLVIYRRVKLLDKLLLLGFAVPVAIAGNILRIMVIVLLAPIVGADNYDLMHEAAGIFFFYATLFFLWWFIHGFAKKEPAKS